MNGSDNAVFEEKGIEKVVSSSGPGGRLRASVSSGPEPSRSGRNTGTFHQGFRLSGTRVGRSQRDLRHLCNSGAISVLDKPQAEASGDPNQGPAIAEQTNDGIGANLWGSPKSA